MKSSPIDCAREHAGWIAQQTLADLEAAGIRPLPDYYRVWYAHLAGDNAPLSKRIRELRQRGEIIDEARFAEIAEEFLHRQDKAVERAAVTLQRLAGQLATDLASIGEGSAAYGQSLSEFGRGLASGSRSTIEALLGDILAESRRMRDSTDALERNVQASTDELQALRRDLAVAWREARTDGLTGLANRRAFDRALGRLSDEARGDGKPLALIMADVDHFKSFNDNFGHRIGDQVLKLIATTLFESVKGSDLAARYGGEEFALILPDTTLENARHLAERIRERVGSREVRNRHDGRKLGQITLSLGVAELNGDEAASELVGRADKALYAAKHAGRNRVTALVAGPAAGDMADLGESLAPAA